MSLFIPVDSIHHGRALLILFFSAHLFLSDDFSSYGWSSFILPWIGVWLLDLGLQEMPSLLHRGDAVLFSLVDFCNWFPFCLFVSTLSFDHPLNFLCVLGYSSDIFSYINHFLSQSCFIRLALFFFFSTLLTKTQPKIPGSVIFNV